MSDLKRLPVKYIRDKCKAAYKKDDQCRICGTADELQFHHYKSLTELFNRWSRKKGIMIKTENDILSCRDEFIEEHREEIFNRAATLCKKCHERLHKIYGKRPDLGTAGKQERWVQRQRDKYGLVD